MDPQKEDRINVGERPAKTIRVVFAAEHRRIIEDFGGEESLLSARLYQALLFYTLAPFAAIRFFPP
jgi:hypothetical protein